MTSAAKLVRARQVDDKRVIEGSGDGLCDQFARKVSYLRISITDRCNYQCSYCTPPEGSRLAPREDVLTFEEITEICRAFAGWGVQAIRLTGGEPTVRNGVVELVRQLKSVLTTSGEPLIVSMTTNGDRLEELARPLGEAGLDSVSVSLDTLDPVRFREITGRGWLERVRKGIWAAQETEIRPIKLNTVAVRGFNDDQLAKLARFAWAAGIVPRFIEIMPMHKGRGYPVGAFMKACEIRGKIEEELGALLSLDDGAGVRGLGPAKYYRVVAGPHVGRRLGIIGAMTESFCSDCNRLRISATGHLHACLARDEAVDLRTAIRSNHPEALASIVQQVLLQKPEGHGFLPDGTGGPRKAMVSIGG